MVVDVYNFMQESFSGHLEKDCWCCTEEKQWCKLKAVAQVKLAGDTLNIHSFYLAAGILYPAAVSSRSPDMNMAVAKYRVAHNRFLQSLQKEDMIIQELQRKAQ